MFDDAVAFARCENPFDSEGTVHISGNYRLP
jgi:hypothetical protein